jgi:CRP-like cAMP-binding protein
MPAAKVGVEFLRSSPVPAALPAKEPAALAAVARDERYRARDYIFMEGDPALWFCLVKTGRVRIFRQSSPSCPRMPSWPWPSATPR